MISLESPEVHHPQNLWEPWYNKYIQGTAIKISMLSANIEPQKEMLSAKHITSCSSKYLRNKQFVADEEYSLLSH